MELSEEFDIVTGSFGYTGKYVTQRLLAAGRIVRTLTSRPQSESPFGAAVQAEPFHFDQPARLTETLRGARTVYNTYWVRFCHGRTTFEAAVENTRTLVRCAHEAGVQRFVHVSIINASADSPLPYFRGKGILEETIKQSGLSYGIVRPALVFGPEDILINNIAWLLRKLPIFGIPGSGEYRLQPILVDDLADIMVDAGASHANIIIDRRRRRRFWTTPWESLRSDIDLFQPESPDSAIAVDRDELVTDLLRRLTDRERQIVVLRYYEEMSIREIAEAMSMKEGTVKSQLHRTLRRMRDTLSARFTFSDLPIEDN